MSNQIPKTISTALPVSKTHGVSPFLTTNPLSLPWRVSIFKTEDLMVFDVKDSCTRQSSKRIGPGGLELQPDGNPKPTLQTPVINLHFSLGKTPHSFLSPGALRCLWHHLALFQTTLIQTWPAEPPMFSSGCWNDWEFKSKLSCPLEKQVALHLDYKLVRKFH